MNAETKWDCKVAGHEWEKRGSRNYETNEYPYKECIYCGEQAAWTEEDEDDFDDWGWNQP